MAAVLEVVGDATRDKDERTSSGMRPRVTHQDTHGAFDDVENVVFRVRVSARTLRVGLKPPFRDGVARFGFEFVGLKKSSNAAHWIGTTLPGTKDYRFARGRARLRHLTRTRSTTGGARRGSCLVEKPNSANRRQTMKQHNISTGGVSRSRDAR